MAVSAYDVQVCVWKMIKISSKTCVNVSKKHPYVTSCLLFLFLLYMCCPLFFWILIYSLPLAVSTWVVLSIRDGRRCKEEREEEREKEREQKERESGGKISKKTVIAAPPAAAASDSDDHGEEEKGNERIKKSYSRVHSVRRRRAKEIPLGDDCCAADTKSSAADDYNAWEAEEEEKEKEKEKDALLSTDPSTDMVDKKALVEESPKEIREVPNTSMTGVRAGADAADISIDNEIYHNSEVVRTLRLLKDEEDGRDETSKVMDVGMIAEAERNKRLESLMARRRSRKMTNLQVRRSLMNNDATMGAQMPPIVIPKANTWCSPSKAGGPFSPGPGSAPSVLIPMRNPFDLPYDPQEEKPDLTGDSFQQEFATCQNRDFMFCRHESFSLGPSLPMDFFEDREDMSSIDDLGFRRRRSSIGYQFPRPENEESDTDFGATTEAESKSNPDSPNSDQIKEVIQVHENDTSAQGRAGEPNTRPNALDELSLSSSTSTSTSSTGSSEDERPPVCKINREAILKSLSMRRNSVSVPDIEMESNDQLQENNLSYANSALENASRLKQQYFADKPQKRHGMTFSIASDMQVEVSEISSPPLTIGENMSYQDDASAYDGEMERNVSWDGLDSWAGSSRMSEAEDNETRLPRGNETGSTRSRKFEDTTQPNSTDEEKHCVVSSTSTGLHDDKIVQTASSESNSDEEDSSVEDAKSSAEETIENAAGDEPAQRAEGEREASSNQAAMDSNDPPQERVHHATISPKSVLQPTLSIASFDHDDRDEVQLSGAHPTADHSSSTPQVVQFTVGTSSNGAAESSQQEQSAPSNASILGAKATESSNEQQKIQENDEKLKQVASDSTSKMVEISSSRSLSSNVEPNAMDSVNEEQKTQESDEQRKQENNSRNAEDDSSSESVKIQVTNQQPKEEMAIQESTHDDSTKTSNNEGQIWNSIPQNDLEQTNNTTTSNHLDGAVDANADEVEDKNKSASHERDEGAQKGDDLHESEAK